MLFGMRIGRRFMVVPLKLIFVVSVILPVAISLRPLREREVGSLGGLSSSTPWPDELYYRRDIGEVGSYSPWNITGTYKGTWRLIKNATKSSRFSNFEKSNGVNVFELVSTQTKISGVHYVQGAVIFYDMFGNENDPGVSQMRVEGVYMWPFRQLRLVLSSGTDGETGEEDYFLSHPYHLLGVFSSHVFQESSKEPIQRRKNSITSEIEKYCNLDISAKVSQVSSGMNGANHERYQLGGLMESSAVDDVGECFSHIEMNATSLNIEVYYNKAVNYTLMVTFLSFLQVLLLIRQMEHSNTQSGAAKVSILMIGQQAILDAYLCLLHLTAGILVESLFNAFATAAFFKFVVFSIFEMRYLLAIWKSTRPMNTGDGWEIMRRELSVLYSRFYAILLGGIFIMYEFHNFLHPILIVMYSFWIPQIVSNVMNDTRKPLHPYYVIGMTVTRLAIPLYMFGCPSNFMRIEVDYSFSKLLGAYLGLQAIILILQHYLGSRWFIPQQILPEKYSYRRKIETDSTQSTDCVICMTAIDPTQRLNDFMVTPCEHFFHTGCLQRWMDIKMECPTCRRPLPPA